jgi:hypothetical protein
MSDFTIGQILLIGVPDVILNLAIGFLIVGYLKYLSFNKKNILNMFLMILIINTFMCIDKKVLGSPAISSLIYVVLYIALIKFLYREKLRNAFIIVLSFNFILITTGLLASSFLIFRLKDGLDIVLSNINNTMIEFLIGKILQFLIVVTLLFSNKIMINIKKYSLHFKYINLISVTLFLLSIIIFTLLIETYQSSKIVILSILSLVFNIIFEFYFYKVFIKNSIKCETNGG